MKRFRQGYQRPLWRRKPARPRPDFLCRGARTPRVVWGLTAVSAIVLGLGMADLWTLFAQASDEQARLDRWERQVATVRKPAAAVTPSTQRAGPLAAWRVTEALAYPWGAIFAAAESTVPADVHWLSFEHDAERPELRLEGVSRNADGALKAADTLATWPGWSTVLLTRLAPGKGGASVAAGAAPEGAPGGTSQRFEITARIDGRAQDASVGRP